MIDKIDIRKYPSSIIKNRGKCNLLIVYKEIKKYIIKNLHNHKKNINIDNYINNYINIIESPLYKNITLNSSENTLKYLFFHIKKGLFIKIINNKINDFYLFNNIFYKNNWSHNIMNIDLLSVNNINKLVCDYNYIQTKDTLEEDINKSYLYRIFINDICKNYEIKDMDIFINIQNYPVLKNNLTEPYNILYKNNNLNNIYQNQLYTPILSSLVNDNYADIPFISTKLIFNYSNNNYNNNEYNNISWDNKKNLILCIGNVSNENIDILNNIKKIYIEDITQNYIINNNYIYINNKITFLGNYSDYKYILTIDINENINIFTSNSIWLRVKNNMKCWYDDLLKEDIHYLTINKDLSNLNEVLDWCYNNKNKCQEITNNLYEFYNNYLTKNNILKYGSFILNKI